MTGFCYFSVVFLVCCTLGHSWESTGHSADDILTGSMSDSSFLNDFIQKRDKRDVHQLNTIDDVLKFLLNTVDDLKSRVSLLEKDNANFQQIIAKVVKITDKKLSKYSCGCLKEMLDMNIAVPCEMTTVITMPTETSSSVQVTPTMSSVSFPESVKYLDSPMEKPLEPGVIAVSYYGSKFYHYIFENKTVDTLTHERRMTYAITFDPVEENIIWAAFRPSAIYRSKVDGANLTTLQEDILSYGLAVDPDKSLLFLTTVSPRQGVGVMFTDGTGYRLIAHVGKYGRPSRITLDRKNEVAFVSFRSRILKVSYDGSEQSVLLRGRYITCLAYDNSNAILYYADRIVINKIKDATQHKPKPLRVTRFKPKSGNYPSDLYVRGDEMYIGYKFKKQVDVMSLTNKTISTLATLDGDFASLCLIY